MNLASGANRPLISFVISVYNVEEYLPAFLDSLTRLDGVAELELIFVIDGSLDGSESLIRAWAAEVALDVEILTKPNGGLSSARNVGMAAARGCWISFPDPDDVLAPDYLSVLHRFLADEQAAGVSMIATHLLQFVTDPDVLTAKHPLDYRFDRPVRIASLNEMPSYFHLHSASGFYRLDAIRAAGLSFHERMRPVFEDGVFTAEYLLGFDAPVMAFLSEATYFYRKRENQTSLTGEAWGKPGKYTDVIRYGHLRLVESCPGPVPRWLQNLILYDLQWYPKADERNQSETAAVPAEILAEFHRLLGATLQHIDDEAIAQYRATGLALRFRLGLLNLKNGSVPQQRIHVVRVDRDQRLMLMRYFTSDPDPRETIRYGDELAEPAYAKTTAVVYFGRPWLYQRDLWVSAMNPVGIEIDGTVAEIVTGSQVVPVYRSDVSAVWSRFIGRMPAREQPSAADATAVTAVTGAADLASVANTVAAQVALAADPMTADVASVANTVAAEVAQAANTVEAATPGATDPRQETDGLPFVAPPAGAIPSPDVPRRRTIDPNRLARGTLRRTRRGLKFALRHLGVDVRRIPASRTASRSKQTAARATGAGGVLDGQSPVPTPLAAPEPAEVVVKRARSSQARQRYGHAWILMDRDTMAQDNAEAFYRYLAAEHPEITIWFVLARSSLDWERLSADGFQLLEYGSTEHIIAMKNADYLLSSQIDDYVVRPYDFARYGRGKWKFVFLQHGVTHNDLSRWINPKPISLLVTATDKETAAIAGDRSPFVFSHKEVKRTGFPRHDQLLRKSRELDPAAQRTILVMPTWRDNLQVRGSGGHRRELRPDFASTRYATEWTGFLGSPELAAVARSHGLRVQFAPHPNLQLHDLFDLPDGIEVIRYADVDIQLVLAGAKVLVTDYSSLAFEAAFLERPVVYFQFDRADFFSGRHAFRRGTFSYETDGFGPVVSERSSAVQAVADMLDVNGERRRYYDRRLAEAFPPRDGRASARLVAAIRESEQPVHA